MGSLTFRDAVITRLVNWSRSRQDFRLYLENGPTVDLDRDERPVVSAEISYTNSEQADLNAQPMIRDEGSILVTVMVKQMTGMRTGYQLREEVANLLQRQDLGGATTQVGRKLPNTGEIKGWVGYRVAIPFWHYYID